MVSLNIERPAEGSSNSYGPIPAGDYDGEIVAADEKISKTGNRYLSVQVKIDGHGSVWEILNLWHPKDTVAQIAAEKLEDIEKSADLVGKLFNGDSDLMLARSVRVRVKIRDDDPQRNEIDAWLPKAGSPVPAASPATVTPAWQG